MNYGKFFRFNYEKSDLDLGIACYDYIWLRDDKKNNELSNFPIYATISKDSIDFHAHYYDVKNDKHSHNTILSLPISANVEIKDGLTGALVEGHKTNFPRYDKEGGSYLWELHWKTFWKNRTWEKTDMSYFELDAFVVPGEEKWEELIDEINKTEEINRKKKYENENDYIGERERKAKSKSEKINRFIRKLILDFLFDLEHTKVFQTSPHYDHISVKLKENFFFSALAAKANFYYWREIIKQEIIDIQEIIDKLSADIKDYLKAEKIDKLSAHIKDYPIIDKFQDHIEKYFKTEKMDKLSAYIKDYFKTEKMDKLLVYIKDYLIIDKLSAYIEYYLKAEKEWTKCIRNPKAQINFNSFKDKWFYDPGEEMDKVYGEGSKEKINNSKVVEKYMNNLNEAQKKEIETYREKSSKWLVWHYEWKKCQWNRMNFLENSFFSLHLFFPKLAAAVLTAWITIIIGSSNLFVLDNASIERGEQHSIMFYLAIVLTIHAVTFYSILHRSPGLWKGDKCIVIWLLFVIRPFKILFLSFIFSLLFGFLLTIKFDAIYRSNLPFLSCVFLAMFIGVVLQQVTDEKYTEE